MADSKKYDGSTWEHSLRKLTTATDTITTLPADVYADGTNATVGLVGNMQQTGTPSPQNPITPSECGERTANLFDIATVTTGYRIQWATGNDYPDDTAVRSDYIPVSSGTYSCSDSVIVLGYDASKNYIGATNGDGVFEKMAKLPTTQFTILANSDCNYIKILSFYNAQTPMNIDAETMLNTGSTALPYEPYGVKIPISSANTTTPVYLGEVESTRQIKQLVFDGTEGWGMGSENFYMSLSSSGIAYSYAYCSHTEYGKSLVNNNGTALWIRKTAFSDYTSAADFKAYLAAQYAAGTPVCVWYVLATPQTAVVNEPIRKIGDYADTVSGITIPTITGKDTFDVDTTLKPSEVSLAYTGWHDARVKEWDGSEWQ